MRTFGLALLVALLPLSAWAQKTSYDFDKTADFSGYKTFTIQDGPACPLHRRGSSRTSLSC
jgi:hypothetical protein